MSLNEDLGKLAIPFGSSMLTGLIVAFAIDLAEGPLWAAMGFGVVMYAVFMWGQINDK